MRLITGALVLALTAPAFGDQPAYSYINGGFESVDLDLGAGFDVDGDGFGIGGSLEVADNWHILGSYSSIGFDFSVDLNRLAIGGGYHTAISETTSFFANVTWENWEVDAGSGFGSIDDDGYGLAVGLRGNVTDRLELAGAIKTVDFGNGGDSTGFNGAAWYRFETFALGLTGEFDDDVTAFGIGGRFYFDN